MWRYECLDLLFTSLYQFLETTASPAPRPAPTPAPGPSPNPNPDPNPNPNPNPWLAEKKGINIFYSNVNIEA